jgi:hypothetical protein
MLAGRLRVLLFGRATRASEGDSNLLGWGADGYPRCGRVPQGPPDVDPARIGGIGLSVGGELMLQTAAETDELAAVVSKVPVRSSSASNGGVPRLERP